MSPEIEKPKILHPIDPLKQPCAQIDGMDKAIYEKWQELGFESGLLGKAKTNGILGNTITSDTRDGIGRYNDFEHGHIYWSPDTLAHEIHGEIFSEWAQLGGYRSRSLGYPITDRLPTTDGIGSYQSFEHGEIYWSASTGAHYVHGAIRDKWAGLGGYRSPSLGYPITDEQWATTEGRYQDFEHGAVYQKAQALAHMVHGNIRAKWMSLGGAAGLLGYPTSDELPLPDGRGRYQWFEHGSIYWSSETGTHEVHGAIRDKWASLNWERGILGYPTDDQLQIVVGSTTTTCHSQQFEHGYIIWRTDIGAHVITGSICDKWSSLGGAGGLLGCPIMDEAVTTDGTGRFMDFTGGSIYWTHETGAHEVHGAIRDAWLSVGQEHGFLRYPISDEVVDANGADRISKFQRGEIVLTNDSRVLFRPNTITFSSGSLENEGVTCWAELGLASNGWWSFRGHAHNSTIFTHNFSITPVLNYIDAQGRTIAVQQKGTVSIEADRDEIWRVDGDDSQGFIVENWDAINQSEVRWAFQANWDIGDDIVTILKILGIISVVAGVVAVIILAGTDTHSDNCRWENGYRCEFEE